ncbi:helix-turn-helix domain-containing protein [Flavobacterium rakeshii]|uniref:helix-turn-helix domain-containing protein n=1 Tax=Flavobacterium rakeshii TaxID=1038845 RepID=UPI002E7BFB8F|nr:helix-turn-helix domain-containing protein [Flavobacterium rakeshii]MEE1899563.1 helix-turn-helix domain-containing protein [Flavobacterium rakeshii]
MSTLGLTLKEARKNLSFTLRQVEETSGISNAYLSQLENDKIKNPSINILSKLSSIYRLPLKELLIKANLIEKDKNKDEEKNFDFAQRVAFKSEDLSDDEKTQVLRYLEFIKTYRQ